MLVTTPAVCNGHRPAGRGRPAGDTAPAGGRHSSARRQRRGLRNVRQLRSHAHWCAAPRVPLPLNPHPCAPRCVRRWPVHGERPHGWILPQVRPPGAAEPLPSPADPRAGARSGGAGGSGSASITGTAPTAAPPARSLRAGAGGVGGAGLPQLPLLPTVRSPRPSRWARSPCVQRSPTVDPPRSSTGTGPRHPAAIPPWCRAGDAGTDTQSFPGKLLPLAQAIRSIRVWTFCQRDHRRGRDR